MANTSGEGPRNRAPLGMKTTNAKAKTLQTPLQPMGTIKQQKSGRRSSTVRKAKQAAPAELQETVTEVPKDVLEDRDVEYAPPNPQRKDNSHRHFLLCSCES